MLIDVTQELKSYKGEQLPGSDSVKITTDNGKKQWDKPMALRQAICDCVAVRYQDEPNLSGIESCRREALARKVFEQDRPDIPAEDLLLIRELAAKCYGPIVLGPLYELVDPDRKEAVPGPLDPPKR